MTAAAPETGRSVRRSIAGTDAVRFDIDPSTGTLSCRQPPDTAHSGDAVGNHATHHC